MVFLASGVRRTFSSPSRASFCSVLAKYEERNQAMMASVVMYNAVGAKDWGKTFRRNGSRTVGPVSHTYGRACQYLTY